ncbi:MAG: ABC transporter ATP-binding protein [Actinomycetes bacterium]|jgi:branched-chain amino acid transport system permease protein|nr:ABC transporter ATP-binding protein [Actinomycetes bacterium]
MTTERDNINSEAPSLAADLLPAAKPMFKKQRGSKTSPLKVILLVILALALIAAPIIFQGFGQLLLIRIFAIVGLYIILAMGLNIVVGYAGLLDFGRMAFYAFGAYAAMLIGVPLAQALGPQLGGWAYVVSLVGGAIVSSLVGFLLSLPVMRLRGDYLAIVTLGFGEIVRICLQNNFLGLSNGAQGLPRTGQTLPAPPGLDWLKMNVYFPINDRFVIEFSSNVYWYYIILILLVVAIIVVRRQDNSRLGRSWAALREDEVAAAAMGVNTTRAKTWAFVLGALWGGVAGATFSYFQMVASPETFNFFNSVLVLAIVVIGGMGSIPGVIVGALAIQGIPEFIRWFAQNFLSGAASGIDKTVSNYRNLILGLLMVVMMAIRPAGLIPSKRIKREIHGAGGSDGSTRVEGDVLVNGVPAGIEGATPGGGEGA